MTPTVSTAESQRRSQIAAAAYERGRRAALAAVHRRGVYARAQARHAVDRTRPAYGPRSDSRAFGLLDTDLAVARASAYLAAAAVAHEMIATEVVPNDPAAQEWSAATLNRTGVHEDAWRERLTEAGIDEGVLRPGLSVDALELPAQLDALDFDEIAEHTLDVSSTAADVEPIRLSDLMFDTPGYTRSDDSVVDITDHVAHVVELDRHLDSGVDGGVDAW
ncbi:TraI DNA relaxase [Rhodococcus sp. NPDC057297]|uniref:TraI DNA relaxase n=1 Tax=Rhodococcus sp. NPDC057297 TaxID=3346090 RepID=UPI00362E53CE